MTGVLPLCSIRKKYTPLCAWPRSTAVRVSVRLPVAAFASAASMISKARPSAFGTWIVKDPLDGFGITWSVGVRSTGMDVVRNTNPSEVFMHPFCQRYVPCMSRNSRDPPRIHCTSDRKAVQVPLELPVPLASKESKDMVITGAVGNGFTTTIVVALVALQPLALVTVME